MTNRLVLSFVSLLITSTVFAQSVWDEGVPVPAGGRHNIYNYSVQDFTAYRDAGKIHAQFYPVAVTGALPPYQPVLNVIEDGDDNPLRVVLAKIVQEISGINSFDQVMSDLGLHPYPATTDTGVYQVPVPRGVRPEHRMGLGFIERDSATGFTFSCAACHSSNLFGKTVLGMTNRFPTANDFFVNAKKNGSRS